MTLKLYWFRGEGKKDPTRCNFGDYLSPLIVEMVSGKKVIYAPIEKADMIAIGTILSRENKAKRFFLPHRLHVWGSGTDNLERRFSSRHHYHAVRGAITLQLIDQPKNPVDIALGDPGLLAARWWDGRIKPVKKYSVGLVPHYVDQSSPEMLAAASKPGFRVIDVFSPVEEVLRSIQECHFILSSSLHGLIMADAFGIPNRRMRLSDRVLSDTKFEDYYSAFSLDEPQPIEPQAMLDLTANSVEQLIGNYQRPGLTRIIEKLINKFPKI